MAPPPEPSPLSSSFRALVASTFFEAQRRQTRHLKISTKFQPADGGAWQISLPERLFGLEGLGLFSFDLFATSAGGQLLIVDEHHPMVTHGRTEPPGADAAITTLRAQYPDVPELHASCLDDADDMFIHGVCSIASVVTDALFYYRCPNNAMPGAAVWVLIKHAVVAHVLPRSLPPNLATLTPPRADFGSYDAVVAAYDAARPVGQAARLNEFRINFTAMLHETFLPDVTRKDLFEGFLHRNGYGVRTTARVDSGDDLVDVVAEVVDATSTSTTPGLTATFDALGRMHTISATLSAAAYANDEYPL